MEGEFLKRNCAAVSEIDRLAKFANNEEVFIGLTENGFSESLVSCIMTTLIGLKIHSKIKAREINWRPWFHRSTISQHEHGDLAILIHWETEDGETIRGVGLIEAKKIDNIYAGYEFDERSEKQFNERKENGLIILYALYNPLLNGSWDCDHGNVHIKTYSSDFVEKCQCKFTKEELNQNGRTFGEQIVLRFFQNEDLNYDKDSDPKNKNNKNVNGFILSKIKETLGKEPSYLLALNNIYNNEYLDGEISNLGYEKMILKEKPRAFASKKKEVIVKSETLKG